MRIIKKIVFALFLLISLTYLFIVVSPRIFKNFYPFGIRTAIVLTGSMEPTLAINDFIIVKKPNNMGNHCKSSISYFESHLDYSNSKI